MSLIIFICFIINDSIFIMTSVLRGNIIGSWKTSLLMKVLGEGALIVHEVEEKRQKCLFLRGFDISL